MVHEVSRTDEAAGRRRAHGADHAGLEVEELRAWYVLAARGIVLKDVDAVELRVVVAEVLAVAADAVFVAKHLLKAGAHLVTALARLHVHNLARRNSLEAGARGSSRAGRSGET